MHSYGVGAGEKHNGVIGGSAAAGAVDAPFVVVGPVGASVRGADHAYVPQVVDEFAVQLLVFGGSSGIPLA